MARKQTLQEYGVNEVVTEIKESVSVVCSQVLYPLEGPQHADIPLDHLEAPLYVDPHISCDCLYRQEQSQLCISA